MQGWKQGALSLAGLRKASRGVVPWSMQKRTRRIVLSNNRWKLSLPEQVVTLVSITVFIANRRQLCTGTVPSTYTAEPIWRDTFFLCPWKCKRGELTSVTDLQGKAQSVRQVLSTKAELRRHIQTEFWKGSSFLEGPEWLLSQKAGRTVVPACGKAEQKYLIPLSSAGNKIKQPQKKPSYLE